MQLTNCCKNIKWLSKIESAIVIHVLYSNNEFMSSIKNTVKIFSITIKIIGALLTVSRITSDRWGSSREREIELQQTKFFSASSFLQLQHHYYYKLVSASFKFVCHLYLSLILSTYKIDISNIDCYFFQVFHSLMWLFIPRISESNLFCGHCKS